MLPRPPIRAGHRYGATGGRHTDTSTAPGRHADTPPAPRHRSVATAERPRIPSPGNHHPEPPNPADSGFGTARSRRSRSAGGTRRAGHADRSQPDRSQPDRPQSARPNSPSSGSAARRHGTAAIPHPRRRRADRAADPVRTRRRAARRRAASVSRRLLREPQRTMQLVMTGLGVAIMVAICGLTGFFVVADERHDAAGTVTQVAPQAPGRDISSRTVDPEPLSVEEVFPDPDVTVTGAPGPYRVRVTNSDTDCHLAASGQVSTLLDALGCTQVIRATMTAPTDGFMLTAGLFNLADEPAATKAHDQLKLMLDAGEGRISGLSGGEGTEIMEVAPAQFGWHTRGHFLAYCVLVRSDGRPIDDGDPKAQRILYDMVELHLRQGVLGKRATAQV